MRVALTRESTVHCLLCDWSYSNNLPDKLDKELIDHLRYAHSRVILSKEEAKKGFDWYGPTWSKGLK